MKYLTPLVILAIGLAVIFGFYRLTRPAPEDQLKEPVISEEDDEPTEIEQELIKGGKDGAVETPEMQALGTTRPAGLFTYRLSGSGISSSATSFTLTSLTLPQNSYPIQDSDLSDTFYITLEPGSTSKQEFIACTTVGANTGGSVSISGCTRGISPISPYTASSTLQFSHSGASAVIFSDPPSLFNEFLALQNSATSTGKHVWASTTPPGYDYVPVNHASGAIVSTTSEFASMAALQAVVASGCLDASTSNQGCVELGTPTEVSSSTADGSQAPLVIPASMATSTPTNCTGILRCIPISIGNYISQAWIDLTANFSWSGQHTHTATTTHSGYVKPDTTFGSWGGPYMPTGTMLTYASSTAPTGFLPCNGAAVSRSTYSMLFAVIGTTYGVGDGSTTFNVPDARGENILFASTTANMGQGSGESNHTLSTAEIPAHTHTVTADVDPSEGGITMTASGDASPNDTHTTSSTGGGAAHNVLDPYLVAFCIIRI